MMPKRFAVLPFAVLALLALSVTHTAPLSAASNPVQLENAKAGTTEWKLGTPGWATGAIEGYASLTSVNRGGQIKLFVNTADPTFTIDIFRMGYYGGLGARRMLPTITLAGTQQAVPAPDPTTGLVECNWINPYVLTVPNSADPTDWMSGVYLAKLTGSSGKQQYIMFVVRDDARPSDLVMAQAVNTHQAYNVWGGKSLYGTIANRADTANKADKVSFDRPYYGDEGNGAALFFNWEYPMIQWLEAEGYDISYATNVDIDLDPNLPLSHKAFLSIGHDEYWSWRMRDNIEGARDKGVSLGFFSGNVSYWQVRYEPSVANAMPARTMVGYKEHWQNDPITPSYLKTTLFRKSPANRPEETMMGVSFITQARPPLVVEDASHWAFSGTGLKNGDALTNPDGTTFLGYEVDAMAPLSPSQTRRLAHSPANARQANFNDMTIYRAPSGATVFSTGSIGWSTTVPQVQQITRNVLARLIANAFTDSPPVRPAPPAPLTATDIGTVGRPGFVALAGPQSFVIDGAGKAVVDGNDALYFVYQTLTGDGQMIVRLKALQLYWDNRAGIMFRQSLSPGSPYVSLVGRPSESIGALNEGVEFKVKSVPGGRPGILGQADLRQPDWMKIVRHGDTFDAFMSADGASWTALGTTTLALGSTVYVGAFVASSRDGVWATASFDNVSISGSTGNPPPPDTTPPSVAITAPGSGASLSNVVTVSATASDNVGVAGVTFSVDGQPLGPEAGAAPYAISWDTRLKTNGAHVLTATARDAAGNTANASISVIVANNAGVAPAFDFDGDGRGDVAVFRPSSGQWLIANQPVAQWGVAGDVPVPGDYNGDRKSDVAVYRPSTGEWWIEGQPTVQWGLPGDVPVPGDYDGDGRFDPAVFRTSDGPVATWFIKGAAQSWAFGLRGDVPVPADFDGDGRADLAVFRPSTGEWFIAGSSTGFSSSVRYQFGLPGDVPLAADFDGDGRADLAVFRPATGVWYLSQTTAGIVSITLGAAGDVPAVVDLDGDGVLDFAVWRPSVATWYVSNGVTGARSAIALGAVGDRPAIARPRLPRMVAGDFDGDGLADITVFRPSTGMWYIRSSSTGYGSYTSLQWGLSGDVSVAGDYDGDGRADAAVYRPSNGTWYLMLSATGAPRAVQWGLTGDIPVAGDYDGDGRTDVAVYRPSSGEWFIRLSSRDYGTSVAYQWGMSGDRPLPGDFDGDGRADLAVYRPSTGEWIIRKSSSGYATYQVKQWGLSGDVAIAADVDGDGRADLAVYRPSTGEWLAADASIAYSPLSAQWGLSGDLPVPLDFDGDGRIDTAVFRPGDGGWYIRRSSDGTLLHVQWGLQSDRPIS